MRQKDSTEHRLRCPWSRGDLGSGVRADGYGLGAMGLSYRAIFVFFMLDRGADEG
ncbi:MAG: hypothetical protein JO119_11605 [Acidobacteria bacterium]|nr:hypothetical protein [Acidobacteriota bacterium]